MNTEQVNNYIMDLSKYDMIQVRTLKSKDLATRGFQKKFQTYPLKSAEA